VNVFVTKMAVIEYNFSVEIEKDVYKKIDWLIKNYEKEIGAFIIGEFKENSIYIEDLIFPEQEVADNSVDTSSKALIKLRKEYGDKCLKIIGHFHSHHKMSAFWSETDETFIKEYMSQREKAIFIVASESDGLKIRAEFRKPFSFSFDELDYKVIDEEYEEELKTELKKIIKGRVKEETYNSWHLDWGNYFEDKRAVYSDKREEGLSKNQKKKLVKNHLDINMDKNEVILKDLQYYTLNEIIRDFKGVSPQIEGHGDAGYKITFKCKNKKRTIDIYRDIKDYLINSFEELFFLELGELNKWE